MEKEKKRFAGKKRFALADFLLIGCLILIGFICLFFRSCQGKDAGFVKITVDGQEYGVYRLTKERQEIPVEIKGKVTNTLEISNGNAKMTHANCPDKLCMRQKEIARQGETIVCLPNKVVAEAVNKNEAEFDSISR